MRSWKCVLAIALHLIFMRAWAFQSSHRKISVKKGLSFRHFTFHPDSGSLPHDDDTGKIVPPTNEVGSTSSNAGLEVSTADILRFCLPTLAIWMSSPILSLIDTSV